VFPIHPPFADSRVSPSCGGAVALQEKLAARVPAHDPFWAVWRFGLRKLNRLKDDR